MKRYLDKLFTEIKTWMYAALALPCIAMLIWLVIHFFGNEIMEHRFALSVLFIFIIVSTCWWWWAMAKFTRVTGYIISTNERFDELLNDLREIKENIGSRKRTIKGTNKDNK